MSAFNIAVVGLSDDGGASTRIPPGNGGFSDLNIIPVISIAKAKLAKLLMVQRSRPNGFCNPHACEVVCRRLEPGSLVTSLRWPLAQMSWCRSLQRIAVRTRPAGP